MERREMKWLRRGCLGCLAFVGLGVLVLALLLLLPLVLQPDPEPVNEAFIPELPPPPVPPDWPSSPEGVTLRPDAYPGADEALRLQLDLSAGSFRVEPGAAGEPLRVEADYDAARFNLDQAYDSESNTYRVSFALKGGWLGFFRGSVEGANQIRIIVPPDRPVALVGEIGVGESRFELGGLWVTDVNLDLGVGEHRLLIREPLRAPLKRIAVDGSVGEIDLQGLGNASPAKVEIDQGIGEMSVDLRGAWQRDATVDLDLGIGEVRVRVPKDVAVKVDRASVGLGEAGVHHRRTTPPEGAPTLTLRLSGGIGEIRVD